MNSYEAYCMYLAVTRHFSPKIKYDYFKYNGKVNVKFETFELKSPVEKARFTKISRLLDPLGYVAGNCLFGASTYIVNFNDGNRLIYDKYRNNGLRFFVEELAHLRDDMKLNFIVNEFNSIPHVLRLFSEGKVSLFTLCILNRIFKLEERWIKSPHYIVFSKQVIQMAKATPWFDVDPDKYIQAVKSRFS